jgi:hypothetical protein
MTGVTIQPTNTTAQGIEVAYTPVSVYKVPQPRVGELSRSSAPRPVYETGMGQPTELDADNRRMKHYSGDDTMPESYCVTIGAIHG